MFKLPMNTYRNFLGLLRLTWLGARTQFPCSHKTEGRWWFHERTTCTRYNQLKCCSSLADTCRLCFCWSCTGFLCIDIFMLSLLARHFYRWINSRLVHFNRMTFYRQFCSIRAPVQAAQSQECIPLLPVHKGSAMMKWKYLNEFGERIGYVSYGRWIGDHEPFFELVLFLLLSR